MNKEYHFKLMKSSCTPVKTLYEASMTLPEEITFSEYINIDGCRSYVIVCPFSKRLLSVFKNFPHSKAYTIRDFIIADIREVSPIDELNEERLEVLNERFRKDLSSILFRFIIYKKEMTDLTINYNNLYVQRETEDKHIILEINPDLVEKIKEARKDPYMTMSIAKFVGFARNYDGLKMNLMSVNFVDALYNNPVDSITTIDMKADRLTMLWPDYYPERYDPALEITDSAEVRQLYEDRIKELTSYL